MKKKKVKWSVLQQEQRLDSLALSKDRWLKKAELEKGLIRKKEVCSREYESESFLRKTDEVDIEFKKNLMEYSHDDSQLRKLMQKSSKGTEESHDFKINSLCVNVGNNEA